MAATSSQEQITVRVPFLDETDIRPGQEGSTTKDGLFLNGYFEPVKSQITQGGIDFHFVKRPGLVRYMNVTPTGPGRGCYRWKQTGNLYSINGNVILSNNTDLGVTLSTTSGFVDFTETRPGAAVQYLGVNDGISLYLIASDNSVIVINNKIITSSSVANPTHITATAHGLNTGNKIIIRNHTGSTPSINDTIFIVTVLDADHFTIPVNVTVGGTGGTIGVFPTPTTGDLHYMDTYWFTMKLDGSIWNCAADDPTTWPVTSFIYAQMLPGRGIGLAKQDNTLIGFTDKHFQMFYDAANPVGSPLNNIEEAMHQLGCISSNAIASQEDSVFWIANTQTGGFTVYQLDGTTNLQEIGTATLNRSLASNFFLTPGSPSAKQTIINSGSPGNWTVPADFNKFNNTIEAIGAGGGGGAISAPNQSGGGGGGAGGYSKVINFDPGGAGTIPYFIGVGGVAFSSGNGDNGTDTTFNSPVSLIAKGGQGGRGAGTSTGGTGGSAGGLGTVLFSGGNGGNGAAPSGGGGGSAGGGGGGGAAGKFANGNNGQNASGTTGGAGGQGDGVLGGIGGVPASFLVSGTGGNGNEWGSAGSGGGGGGNAGFAPGAAGAGGLYGGGGGGGSIDFGVAEPANAGTGGVIVITYVPTTAATDSSAANGYILRIAGHTFYVLNLVNTRETWVYDQTHKIWCKWTSGFQFFPLSYFPVVNAVQYAPAGQPQVVVGQDPTTGTIWQIDSGTGQDDGGNYEFLAQTVPLTFGNMKRKFYNQVELIGDRQAVTTPVAITYTDDDYTTFQPVSVFGVNLVNFDLVNIRNFKRAWGNSRRRAWKASYKGGTPSVRIYGFEFTIEMENE